MVDYLIPTSLDEVLEFINKHKSKMISGGTDLFVQRRNWADVEAKFEEKEVYIFNLKELNYIAFDGELHIGATTPLSRMLQHEDVPQLLKEAISIMASPALRNVATLPGNIVNASPAGDTLPILYVLDAKVKIESVNGMRISLVKDIIIGPRKTTLLPNEMITEIIIPKTTFTNSSFIKVGGRKADAISKLSFTYAVNIEDEIVKDMRIAFGAVAPVVVRSKEIEDRYIGLSVQEIKSRVDEICEEYKLLIVPIDDQRSNKVYRKHVSLKLLKDFIEKI